MSHRPDIAREIVRAELGRLAKLAEQAVNPRVYEALDGLTEDLETELETSALLREARDTYQRQAETRDEECELIRLTIRRWIDSENEATHYHVHDPSCPHCVLTAELVNFAKDDD